MAKFKVYRYKRYEAVIDTFSASLAVSHAIDVPGRDWKLIEDKVEGIAAGLDSAEQRHEEDLPFEEKT